jgi:II/X family phage/plasmid replication protein
MIDRLLLSLNRQFIDDDVYEYLIAKFDSLERITTDGEILWSKPLTAKTRSDDPNVNFRFTSKGIQIWGSPAMVDNKNNVFGSSDIVECAIKLINKASKGLGIIFPSYEKWDLQGLDITHNFYLDNFNDVKTALNALGKLSDGRLKTVRYPESVYFGMGSQTRTLKVYSKGVHMNKLARKDDVGLTTWELAATYNLLRVECVLKKKWLERYFASPDETELEHYKNMIDSDRPVYNGIYQTLKYKRWYEMNEDDLNVIYTDFWEHIAGNGVDVPAHEPDLEAQILDAAALNGYTEGLGKAAFKTWTVIKAVGKEQAQYMTGRSTWYQHIKLLKLAGLTTADISEAVVLKTRINTIDLTRRVESFDDIKVLINNS